VNRLLISATLLERQALRHTPAGLPALDVLLKHESELFQEGQARKVSLELKARAIGSTVQALAALAVGARADFAGFLAGSRNGRGLVFHILEQHNHPAAAPDASAATDSD
jgi:primosomal replication protein N